MEDPSAYVRRKHAPYSYHHNSTFSQTQGEKQRSSAPILKALIWTFKPPSKYGMRQVHYGKLNSTKHRHSTGTRDYCVRSCRVRTEFRDRRFAGLDRPGIGAYGCMHAVLDDFVELWCPLEESLLTDHGGLGLRR